MAEERALSDVRRRSLASFTLIELMVVIIIIIIIATFSLSAARGVATKASRSRASAEIRAIGTGLEGYKTDNEIYPPSTGLTPGIYAASDGTGGPYIASSTILFSSLAGTTNFLIAPAPGTRVYLSFNPSQVGNQTGASYVEDPWGYAYGYATGPSKASAATSATTPYNGVGFYDLWTTGDSLAGTANFTNTWITNWK
jgi:type II secretory pathway pseudopilin PulG